MSDKKVIQSYIKSKSGNGYFVSTINREYMHLTYGSETIVWEFDFDTRESGKMIDMDGGGPVNDIETHFKICRQIFENDKIESTGK